MRPEGLLRDPELRESESLRKKVGLQVERCGKLSEVLGEGDVIYFTLLKTP